MRLERGSAASPLSKGSDRRSSVGSKNTPARKGGRGRRVRTTGVHPGSVRTEGRTRRTRERRMKRTRDAERAHAGPRERGATDHPFDPTPTDSTIHHAGKHRSENTAGRKTPLGGKHRWEIYDLRLFRTGSARRWCAPRRGPATVERASTRFVDRPAGTRRQGRTPPCPPGLAIGNCLTGGLREGCGIGDPDPRGWVPVRGPARRTTLLRA